MENISVSIELATSLLDAALRTALSHRGKKREEYALGQLEAISNVIYILCINQGGMENLELACMQQATMAVRRLDELENGLGTGNDSVSLDF